MDLSRWTRTCSLSLVAALVVAAPAAAVKRRAFATSVAGSGDLESWPDSGGAVGLAAGDEICRARAAAAGLPNATAYRAWLSSGTTDAYCHVKGLSGSKGSCAGGPGDAAGPWYLVNGITNFTGDLDELTGPEHVIYRPVTTDEFGTPLTQSGGKYWTSTNVDGTASVSHCSGWTSGSSGTASSGHGLATVQSWTSDASAFCSEIRRLLCLEPGPSEYLGSLWSPGTLLFVTSASGTGDLGSWAQAGPETGLDAGDAICQSLAAAAHLPSPASFVAWLSTDAVHASDRLTTDGPFKRIDGFTVANSVADLTDNLISNSLHQDEAGDYLAGQPFRVWTGTQGTGIASGFDCAAWTSGLDTFDGTEGLPNFARTALWTHFNDSANCDASKRLYCFSNIVTLFWDGFDYTGDASRWSSVVP